MKFLSTKKMWGNASLRFPSSKDFTGFVWKNLIDSWSNLRKAAWEISFGSTSLCDWSRRPQMLVFQYSRPDFVMLAKGEVAGRLREKIQIRW
jgi:hypothetical protein